MQFFSGWLNEGERYEKMPRFLPYAILPISMALLLFRFIQAGFRIWRGEQLLLIETHDVDDDLQELEDSGLNLSNENSKNDNGAQ